MKDFSFPIFVKGNRQTNCHKKSQCIIHDSEALESLKAEWCLDEILSWQKAAVREFVPLQTIDDTSFPNMIPISYEFRFFYFYGRCMGYGPYWTIGKKYSIDQAELKDAASLAEWAAIKLGCTFVAIDVAKTAVGDWIIIEVNDAQESGFNGVEPHILWSNIIKEAEKQKS